MRISLCEVLVAAMLTVPVVASAQQSDHALTRAQVRAELIRLEQVGYHPGYRADSHYPADIQAATAKLQATAGATRDAAFPGYGGGSDGLSQTGSRTSSDDTGRSIYFGR